MYIGADYYPEHWDRSLIEEDIKRMKDLGINMVRIGEFAWHLMEPVEGEYDFSYFDMVISKLKENNIKVMFGTPTATFPAWLFKKYPGIVMKDKNGLAMSFGGRRQYCFNSNIYWDYTKKIVSKLIDHYKDEETIVAWQIDNELGHEGSDMCYCENCQAKFKIWLKEKYKIIDELNNRWGTIFWGQTYNDFDEVPAPLPTITTHNPSLKLDWARFRSDSLNDYANMQVDLVKKLKGDFQTVTTNLSGGFFTKYYDHFENTKNMDFVSYDNYPVWGGLKEPNPPFVTAATHDFVRGLKDQNFWVVEELIGAQGHDVIGYLPRPNQAKMWAYQAFGHGCNNMLFFRWRGMTKGAEQYCYGIIDQDNETGRKYEEVKDFFEDIVKYEEVVNSKIKSEIAILYDYDNVWSWLAQSQSQKFDFSLELMRTYVPFYKMNTNIDIIPVNKNIDNYKIIVMPVMKIVTKELHRKLDDFVKKGGILILTFRTGLKDKDNNILFGQVLPGYFREMAGIKVSEIESLQEGQKVKIKGHGEFSGLETEVEIWREILEAETAEVLYSYADGLFKDKACVTLNNYGKGKVVYIGGGVGSKALDPLFAKLIKEVGIYNNESEMGLEVYPRELKGEKYLFITNHTDKVKKYKKINFSAYQSKIIKESDIEV